MTLDSQLIVRLADGALEEGPYRTLFRVANDQFAMNNRNYTEFDSYNKIWSRTSDDRVFGYVRVGDYGDTDIIAKNPWMGWPWFKIGWSEYQSFNMGSMQTVGGENIASYGYSFLWRCTRFPDDWDYTIDGKALPDEVPRVYAKHFLFEFVKRTEWHSR
jgi:hypothetical protein